MDILLARGYWQEKNKQEGFKKFLEKLPALNIPVHIVMESTGVYQKPLAKALALANIPVSIENPKKVRDFAKAFGKLAKTDKVDA